ncbi:oligosaccharide flippase family protein [Maribacter sp. CXY002]|uniref:oligosaccharide flippase family protein n=1 Tax=Maribacter luteocoastalis TaxID=3407671 RepID=UPI003B67BE76
MATNQLKAGAVLSYVVLGASNLVGLFYTPYMLRMMGKSEYGLYALVASVIAYLTIMDFGFGNAIIRYTAKLKAEGKVQEQYSMFGLFVLLYSAIGIISFVIGLSLYYNVDHLFGNTMSDNELEKAKIMMLLMVFNIAFTFPLSIFGSIITAYEDFVFQKIVVLFRIVLNTVIMILLLEMGYKAIGMVILATVLNILTLIINFWYCKKKLKIRITFTNMNVGLLKEVSTYSFYIFLNIIMNKVYWSTGQFVLGIYVGTAAVAVFAIAIQLQGMYMSFSTAISGVFLPKVTGMVASNKSKVEISDLFIRTGRIQFIILAFILSGFILFGRQFIILWAGNGYEDTYLITLLFFVALTIPLVQNLGITILQARNQMEFRSWLYFGMAILSLCAQIPLTKYYGGIGAAFGISVALIIGNVLIMNVYYHKKQFIDIITFWKQLLGMSIVPTILTSIAYWLIDQNRMNSWTDLVLGIIGYSAIYLPLFWYISMNSYERDLFVKPIYSAVKRIKEKMQ